MKTNIEWAKSRESLTYFARNQIEINNPEDGIIDFNLYPYQKNFLLRIQAREYYIVSKARQMGITTIELVTALWFSMFNKGYSTLFISPNHSMIKHLSRTFDGLYEGCKLDTKTTVNLEKTLKRFDNGSVVQFWKAIDKPNFPQRYFDFIIVDEAAYIDDKSMEWLQTHIESRRKVPERMLITSTPKSDETWFDSTFMKALRGQNLFIPMQLDWTLHPERDLDWRREMDDRLGTPTAGFEFDGNVEEIWK